MVSLNHKSISLLLHNCDVAPVTYCDVNIWDTHGIRCISLKGIMAHRLRTTVLKEPSNKMTPSDLVSHTYLCLLQPSSENLLPTVNGSEYRDHSSALCTVLTLGTLSPKLYVSIKPPSPGLSFISNTRPSLFSNARFSLFIASQDFPMAPATPVDH